MPYKSDAQRRWAHTPDGIKALGGKDKVKEWDDASKGKDLPEKVSSAILHEAEKRANSKMANALKELHDAHAPDSDLREFEMGMDVELEHGTKGESNNITDDDPGMTADIAAVHLKEMPDYYTRLKKMEEAPEPKGTDENSEKLSYVINILGEVSNG